MRIRARDSRTQSRRINDVGKSVRKVSPETVARELGATLTYEWIATRQGPVNLLALRQEILNRLESTGGRPKLAGTDRRQKIPLKDSDWHQLERLAALLRGPGLNVTAGQIASALLHSVLHRVRLLPVAEGCKGYVDVDPHSQINSPPKVLLEVA